MEPRGGASCILLIGLQRNMLMRLHARLHRTPPSQTQYVHQHSLCLLCPVRSGQATVCTTAWGHTYLQQRLQRVSRRRPQLARSPSGGHTITSAPGCLGLRQHYQAIVGGLWEGRREGRRKGGKGTQVRRVGQPEEWKLNQVPVRPRQSRDLSCPASKARALVPCLALSALSNILTSNPSAPNSHARHACHTTTPTT